jgi:hypothetical protein
MPWGGQQGDGVPNAMEQATTALDLASTTASPSLLLATELDGADTTTSTSPRAMEWLLGCRPCGMQKHVLEGAKTL